MLKDKLSKEAKRALGLAHPWLSSSEEDVGVARSWPHSPKPLSQLLGTNTMWIVDWHYPYSNKTSNLAKDRSKIMRIMLDGNKWRKSETTLSRHKIVIASLGMRARTGSMCVHTLCTRVHVEVCVSELFMNIHVHVHSVCTHAYS